MITTELKPFLSTAELQKRWSVSHMTIVRLRRDQKLRAYRFGIRGVRFSLEDILKFERDSAA